MKIDNASTIFAAASGAGRAAIAVLRVSGPAKPPKAWRGACHDKALRDRGNARPMLH
jgi:tRNA U34 5-carboxymethylaminomethyl modifying GTPase MnmE/TrmE